MKGGGLGRSTGSVVEVSTGEDDGEGEEIPVESDELDVLESDFVNLLFS